MGYPKWIYHKTLEAKIVHSEEEHLAHKGWEETPAAFFEDPKSEKPDLMSLKEDELISMLKGSKLKPSTLKRKTKLELIKMIEEQDGNGL